MKNIYLIFCLLTIPAVCFADDDTDKKDPQLIADVWIMTPKAGHEADFYAALKEHVKFRTEKNDPRTWQVSNPVTGDNTNTYLIRACCFEWSTQDSYTEWAESSGVQKHWGETASQHVDSYNHDFIVIDTKNSHWIEGTIVNYVGVRRIKVKNGSHTQMNNSIKSLSKFGIDNKWPHSWSWTYPVSGSSDVNFIIPFENYAAMAPLEESFYQYVLRVHESKDEAMKLFDEYSDSIESSTYTIYKKNTELTMTHKEEK